MILGEKWFLKMVLNIWKSRHLARLSWINQIFLERKMSFSHVWLWRVFVTLWWWFSEWGCWQFKSPSRLRPCVCYRETESLLSAPSYSFSFFSFLFFLQLCDFFTLDSPLNCFFVSLVRFTLIQNVIWPKVYGFFMLLVSMLYNAIIF